ncbi:hypothetical protein EKO23_24160 [Nocardioides guangzhouensis]|uniref:Uncharacterized protein n=1 Tax=Nocardioides guangzhouensis TaxID=2497878 RepID=A0A4Q4Z299_9ACTN|nr:hypothetical protein [Nocardioides guangzhouensis]RYP81011.1 hypothetical protein EKO23_24160 [Nocardioides guangzhouensis]
MPVEDRLRRGLEANARAFVPEGEKRLVEVRRRHRARTGTIAAAMAAAVVVGAVFAGTLLGGSDRSASPQPAKGPTEVSTSAGTYAGPRIPDSGWRRVVTREQFVRAGADRAFLADDFGRADRLPVTLSFIGTVYSLSGRYPAGWSVGDAGTVEYAPDGRLQLTSTAPGCRGCVGSLSWRIRGNRLLLGGFRGTPDDPMASVMLEGTWTRIGD